MKSLKLDVNTNKLLIPFQTVEGDDKVRQDLLIVLRRFYKEWFLDQRKGVKYKELIFDKRYSEETKKEIETHLRSEIKSVKDVTQIKTYSQTLINTENNYYELNVNFSVKTSFNGEVSINKNLTLGV